MLFELLFPLIIVTSACSGVPWRVYLLETVQLIVTLSLTASRFIVEAAEVKLASLRFNLFVRFFTAGEAIWDDIILNIHCFCLLRCGNWKTLQFCLLSSTEWMTLIKYWEHQSHKISGWVEICYSFLSCNKLLKRAFKLL